MIKMLSYAKLSISRFFSRYLFDVNLVSFSVLSGLFALIFWYQVRKVAGPVAVAITSVVGCSVLYALYRLRIFELKHVKTVIKHGSSFIERYTYLLLAGFIIIYLVWSGLVIFLNPFEWSYNHGDASFWTQTLFNLADGLRPESSYYAFPVEVNEPRFVPNAYGYVPIFNFMANWVPWLVLPPLYAVYPHPPMNIFAPMIVIIIVGLPGMFWAVRSAGGSKTLALLGAVGYALLPQVEGLLFHKGYLDILALAVMPWVLGALLARKWWAFYVSSVCLAAIGYPYVYTVMIIGIATAVFFKGVIPGTIVFLVGFVVMKWDSAVCMGSILPYYQDVSEIPSFLKYYILDRTIGSLITPFKVNIGYMGIMLQAGAFLPLLALRRNHRWNSVLAGLLAITCFSGVLMLFRSIGWNAHRNANFIVPLYVCAFKAFVDIAGTSGKAKLQNGKGSPKITASICLLCSMISMILVGSPYESHYPWGGVKAKLNATEFTMKCRVALANFERYVPADAQLAVLPSGNFSAVLTNRQHVWRIGREPEGVKYYVVIGKMTSGPEEAESAQVIEKIRQDKAFKLLYEDTSIPMVIFENLKAYPIPRDESLLGWSVLNRAFRFLY